MSKRSLLLVDGDARSLRVLEVSLKKAGFLVTTAENGRDALDKVQAAQPDLIVSDTDMPEMDGFELCRTLRSNPTTANIPIVFLTGQTAIEHKIRGLELGVDEYLTKPIYIKEILTRLRILLQKKDRNRLEAKRDPNTRFSGTLADMGVVDLIQTIEVSRKSGLVHFTASDGRRATIYFRKGKVIDADCGQLQSEEAVYRLLTWSEGEFELLFRTVRRKEQIHVSTQGLLMEGMRRLDEWGRLNEQLPPLDTRFEVDVDELVERLADLPDELNTTLRLFDGGRSLIDVIDMSSVGDLECLERISRLYFEGLLKEAGATNEAGQDELSAELITAARSGEPTSDEDSGPLLTSEASESDILEPMAESSAVPPAASEAEVSEEVAATSAAEPSATSEAAEDVAPASAPEPSASEPDDEPAQTSAAEPSAAAPASSGVDDNAAPPAAASSSIGPGDIVIPDRVSRLIAAAVPFDPDEPELSGVGHDPLLAAQDDAPVDEAARALDETIEASLPPVPSSFTSRSADSSHSSASPELSASSDLNASPERTVGPEASAPTEPLDVGSDASSADQTVARIQTVKRSLQVVERHRDDHVAAADSSNDTGDTDDEVEIIAGFDDATPLPDPEPLIDEEQHVPGHRIISSRGAEVASVSGEVSTSRGSSDTPTARDIMVIAPRGEQPKTPGKNGIRTRNGASSSIGVEEAGEQTATAQEAPAPAPLPPPPPVGASRSRRRSTSEPYKVGARAREPSFVRSLLVAVLGAIAVGATVGLLFWWLGGGKSESRTRASGSPGTSRPAGSTQSAVGGGASFETNADPTDDGFEILDEGHDSATDDTGSEQLANVADAAAKDPEPPAARDRKQPVASTKRNQKAEANDPTTYRELFEEAKRATRHKENERALALIERALELRETAPAFTLKADLLLAKGDRERALAAAETAVILTPTYAPGWYFRGHIYRMFGKNDRARESFERYLELAPNGNKVDEVTRILDSL